ncbi:helix-turn-helix transcriptional regulator [Aneurinibacillus thermoaerophilus]|uniref:helix-turn-helix domain-containing protein n=1 Tax=Aneurinibacillus thermoaerophilus TaxID=143495 RepID=UPI002E1B1494|nr:helix-turn-helix transcriptional regulator [Aneurinibacillus thermoaerophilus]
MAELKQKLRELRKKHKLTQKEVADFLGITESAYGYYEQGRNEPSLDTIRKLANKYEVSIAYLIGESTDNSAHESSHSIQVSGQNIKLSSAEFQVLQEMRKHPQFAAMFHDLATAPEKKVKTLIKMWEVIKADLDEEDEQKGIIED